MRYQRIICHPSNDYTGSTRVLATLIQDEWGPDNVAVITSKNKTGFLSDISGLKIINSPLWIYRGNLKIFKAFNRITSIFQQIFFFILTLKYGHSASQIYLNTITPMGAAIAGRLMKKNITYHIHEKLKVKWHSFPVLLAEWVFNHVKSTRIYVSEYTKKCYLTKNNCPEQVKYNCLPSSFISSIPTIVPKIKNHKTITLISSPARVKGIFLFVDLAIKMPQYPFLMVLSTTSNVLKNILPDKCPDNLTVLPAQSDISKIYLKSDLVLNLSNPDYCVETFGLTLVEAMAYGLPVIAPNFGGPKEIVIDKYNGRLIDPRNIIEISNVITEIFETPGLYETYSTNALSSVKRFYPIKKDL